MSGEGARPSGEQAQLDVPAPGAGRWRVRTETACYELDLEIGTARRCPLDAPGPGWARVATLRGDGRPIALTGVLRCRVGEPMLLALNLRGDGVLTFRTTTPVVLIIRLGDSGSGAGTGSDG